MLFNSIEFTIFLPIVFLLYWFFTNNDLKIQNALLLVASYFFYGWWDWRFLFLLFLLSLSNYFIGIRIESSKTIRTGKIWLILGFVINICVLGVFKYYNFFINAFIDLVSLTGYDVPISATNIILPIGISFYVFLSLSYIIDIYKKNINANRKIGEVLLTLSFFPIILAGPIQRPASLLPQISKRREFNYAQAIDGLRQILWGLFAKVVIADNLALYVDDIFSNFSDYSGSTLLLGALFFTIQIYADFSGYSNMAIGIAKLFGFSLMQNFAYPYFSRDITGFWKKWHISLTTWFRDYLFMPISFSISWRINRGRVLLIKTEYLIFIIASFITWFLTGLWHGANYTFIIWGTINGILLIIYHLQRKPRKRLFNKMGINNNNLAIVGIESLFTLIFIVIAWVFFRAESVGQAINYLSEIFSASLLTIPEFLALRLIIIVMFFFIIEWLGKEQQYAIAQFGLQWHRSLRWLMYFGLIAVIFLFSGVEQQFIYFKF